MAKADFGVLSPFTGKVGTVEGYIRRGQLVIRKVKNLKKVYPATEKQLAQRMKFRLVSDFTREITEFVRTGFENKTIGTTQTANNLAKSHQMKYAVQGKYPNFSIDYSQVLLSSGDLKMSKDLKVSRNEEGASFSWVFNREQENPTDQVMIMIYPANQLYPIYEVSGARRSEEIHNVPVPEIYTGAVVHCYISFISDNRKRIASSVYLGEIKM